MDHELGRADTRGETGVGVAAVGRSGRVTILRPQSDELEGRTLFLQREGAPPEEVFLPPGRTTISAVLPPGRYVARAASGGLCRPDEFLLLPDDEVLVESISPRPLRIRITEAGNPLPGVRCIARADLGDGKRWEARCTSDADGRAQVLDCPWLPIGLWLQAPDGRVGYHRFRPSDLLDDEVHAVEFEAGLPATEVHVVDSSSGAPIPGVRLIAEGRLFDDVFVTSTLGVVQLPQRSKRLDQWGFSHEGYREQWAVLTDRSTTTIELDPLRTAMVTVFGPDGNPLEGARVRALLPTDDWSAHGPYPLRGVADALTDEQGRAEVPLPPGSVASYWIAAWHPRGAWGGVRVGGSFSGPLELTLESGPDLEVVVPPEAAAGGVVLAAGQDGSRRTVLPEHGVFQLGDAYGIHHFTVRLADGGRTRVERWARLDSPWAFLHPSAASLLAGRMTLEPPDGQDVTIVLRTDTGEAKAHWPVRLVPSPGGWPNHLDTWPDYEGSRPSNLRGWVLPVTPEERRGISDENGRIEIQGLAPGDWYLFPGLPHDPFPTRLVPGSYPWDFLFHVPATNPVVFDVPPVTAVHLAVTGPEREPVAPVWLELTTTDFLRSGEVVTVRGRSGRIDAEIAWPHGQIARVVAWGFEPFPLAVSDRTRPIVRDVALRPAPPMFLVPRFEGAPARSIELRFEFERPIGAAPAAQALGSVRHELDPDETFELSAPFPGCVVRVRPLEDSLALKPDTFVFAPGRTLPLTITRE